MHELLTGIAGGLLGSAHCIGMCGGFAAAMGTTELPLGPVLRRQMAYGLGRVCTYAFLGAVAGMAGLYLTSYGASLVTVQRGLSIIAGLIMVLIGLAALEWIPWRMTGSLGLDRVLAPLFQQCLSSRSRGAFFTIGLLNGLLPCGLVYAFLALAVSRGDLLSGLLLMAAFGVGTMPAMLSIGCGAGLLSHTVRRKVFRVAAGIIVFLGGMTVYRALPATAESCCEGHEPVVVFDQDLPR